MFSLIQLHVWASTSIVNSQWFGNPDRSRCVFALALWVDNCVAFSQCGKYACEILDLLEERLQQYWNLDMKMGSKSVVTAQGTVDHQIPEHYNHVEDFDVMKYTVSHDGSIATDYHNTTRRMWAAFWSNFKSPKTRALTIKEKICILNRVCTPHVYNHCCM